MTTALSNSSTTRRQDQPSPLDVFEALRMYYSAIEDQDHFRLEHARRHLKFIHDMMRFSEFKRRATDTEDQTYRRGRWMTGERG